MDNFYNNLKKEIIDKGPNATLILNLVYNDLYKRNIRLDLVEKYANTDYDIYQMFLIRKALFSNLSDIEIDFILSLNIQQDQKSEVINALRTDVPYLTVKKWLQNNYTAAQIELATRCWVLNIGQADTDYLISLNLDDEMTQYVKQALQYGISVDAIKKFLNGPLIDFKRAIRSNKNLYKARLMMK